MAKDECANTDHACDCCEKKKDYQSFALTLFKPSFNVQIANRVSSSFITEAWTGRLRPMPLPPCWPTAPETSHFCVGHRADLRWLCVTAGSVAVRHPASSRMSSSRSCSSAWTATTSHLDRGTSSCSGRETAAAMDHWAWSSRGTCWSGGGTR